MKNKNIIIIFSTIFLLALAGCSISYTLNGASIDYTKTKSITIIDFPNQAPLVYPPLAQTFTEGLKDKYIRQTRLQIVQDNGDLHIEGEITGYDFTQLAVKEDAYASETELKITIRVRYRNQTNPTDDFEQTFSASRPFSNDRMPQDVQDELCQEIIEELADQIYNATVANW